MPTAQCAQQRGGGGPTALSWSLLAFAVLPPAVYLASEVDKSIRFGSLRGVEVADIAVAYPVWVAVICNVHWRVSRRPPGGGRGGNGEGGDESRAGDGRALFWAAGVLLLCAFTYGHAMHWTANAVNTYMTEYNLEKRLRARVDDEVYELVYWLDEHLGHAIFFTSLHAFVAAWTVASAAWASSAAVGPLTDSPGAVRSAPDAANGSGGSGGGNIDDAADHSHQLKTTPRSQRHPRGLLQWLLQVFGLLLPVAAGGACGIVHSVAFIEGSSLALGRALAGSHLATVAGVLATAAAAAAVGDGNSAAERATGSAAVPRERERRQRSGEDAGGTAVAAPPSRLLAVTRSEVVRFTAALGTTVLGATTAYGWLFPGGETPSDLGGWWCVAIPSRFDYCTQPLRP